MNKYLYILKMSILNYDNLRQGSSGLMELEEENVISSTSVLSKLFVDYQKKKSLHESANRVLAIKTKDFIFAMKILEFNKKAALGQEPLPEEISNLFIINDIAQSNDNLIKWVTMPVIYIENKLHQIRNRMIKEYKILLFYEKGYFTLNNYIEKSPNLFDLREVKLCINNIHNGIIGLQEVNLVHLDLKIDNIVFLDTYKIIDYDESKNITKLKDQQIQHLYNMKILDSLTFQNYFNIKIDVQQLTVDNSGLLFDLFFFLATLLINKNRHKLDTKVIEYINKKLDKVQDRIIEYRPLSKSDIKNIFKQSVTSVFRSKTKTRFKLKSKTKSRKYKSLSPYLKKTKKSRSQSV